MDLHRRHPSHPRRGNRALATLAALGLLAAACGDDDDPSSDADAASDETSSGTGEADPESDVHDHEHDESGHDEAADIAEADDAADAQEHGEPQPRLVLGDGETGDVEVLDLISGEVVDTLETDGLGALHSIGRFVFAVDSDNDRLTVVDGGSWVVDHGDHSHAYTADPAIVGTATGSNPIHTVYGDEEVTVFFDDDGVAEIFTLDDLEDGDVEPSAEVATSAPHHGVVVPLEGHYVVSVPAPNPDDLPTGVEVRHGREHVEASFERECPELHGEAGFDDGVLFACEEGLLWVRGGHEGWEADRIDYPARDGDGDVRVGSFAHEHGIPVVAGQFDDDSVAIVDTSGEPEIVIVELGEEVRALAVADDGDSVIALTTDGAMHLVDTASGEIETSAEVFGVDPLPEDAEWWEPRRRMVVEGERAYVSDPDENTVTEVAINDGFRETRTFDAGVVPEFITVVGNTH